MSHVNSLIGTSDPIIVELTYEDWRRLERLRNHHSRWEGGHEWLLQFYDAVLKKAGLKRIEEYADLNYTLEIHQIVCGYRAYAKYEKLMKKKYEERDRPWIDLQHGPSAHLHPEDPPITPDQILIKPSIFGIHVWSSDVFR